MSSGEARADLIYHDVATDIKGQRIDVLTDVLKLYPGGVLDAEGNTFYHYAVKHDQPSVLKWMIDHPELASSPHYPNLVGETSLHHACRDGRMECFSTLWYHSKIPHNVWSKIADKQGNTPVHMACLAQTEMVKKILSSIKSEITLQINKRGQSVMHLAAAAGNISTVRLLCFYDQLVTTSDIYGATPVHYAAVSGHYDVVKYLLPRMPRRLIMSSTGSYMNILHAAVSSGNTKLVHYLFSKLPERLHMQITSTGATMLHLATAGGHSETLRYLLSLTHLHRIINYPEHKGYSAAHVAVNRNWPECLEILIKHQAHLHLPDRTGMTVFQLLKISQTSGMEDLYARLFEGRRGRHAARVQYEYYSQPPDSTLRYTQSQFDSYTQLRERSKKRNKRRSKHKKRPNTTSEGGHPRVFTMTLPDNPAPVGLKVRKFNKHNMALPGYASNNDHMPVIPYQTNVNEDISFDVENSFTPTQSMDDLTKLTDYEGPRHAADVQVHRQLTESRRDGQIFFSDDNSTEPPGSAEFNFKEFKEDYTTEDDHEIYVLTFHDPMSNSIRQIRTTIPSVNMDPDYASVKKLNRKEVSTRGSNKRLAEVDGSLVSSTIGSQPIYPRHSDYDVMVSYYQAGPNPTAEDSRRIRLDGDQVDGLKQESPVTITYYSQPQPEVPIRGYEIAEKQSPITISYFKASIPDVQIRDYKSIDGQDMLPVYLEGDSCETLLTPQYDKAVVEPYDDSLVEGAKVNITSYQPNQADVRIRHYNTSETVGENDRQTREVYLEGDMHEPLPNLSFESVEQPSIHHLPKGPQVKLAYYQPTHPDVLIKQYKDGNEGVHLSPLKEVCLVGEKHEPELGLDLLAVKKFYNNTKRQPVKISYFKPDQPDILIRHYSSGANRSLPQPVYLEGDKHEVDPASAKLIELRPAKPSRNVKQSSLIYADVSYYQPPPGDVVIRPYTLSESSDSGSIHVYLAGESLPEEQSPADFFESLWTRNAQTDVSVPVKYYESENRPNPPPYSRGSFQMTDSEPFIGNNSPTPPATPTSQIHPSTPMTESALPSPQVTRRPPPQEHPTPPTNSPPVDSDSELSANHSTLEPTGSLTSVEQQYMVQAVREMMSNENGEVNSSQQSEAADEALPLKLESPAPLSRQTSESADIDSLARSMSYKLNYDAYRRRVVKNEGTATGLFEYLPTAS